MFMLTRCARYFPALFVFALAIPLVRAQKAPIEITADLWMRRASCFMRRSIFQYRRDRSR